MFNAILFELLYSENCCNSLNEIKSTKIPNESALVSFLHFNCWAAYRSLNYEINRTTSWLKRSKAYQQSQQSKKNMHDKQTIEKSKQSRSENLPFSREFVIKSLTEQPFQLIILRQNSKEKRQKSTRE